MKKVDNTIINNNPIKSCLEQNNQSSNKTTTQMSQHQQDEIMEQHTPVTWETWTEEYDIKLKIRLAGFGHFCILRGKMILESYFLILSKKWMKAVIVGGDEVMILIKQSSRTKRFRMTFFNELDAKNFFTMLSKFAATNNTTLTPNNELINVNNSTETETILNNMLNNPIHLPESWSTEWPTQSLEGLIRLCLIDPNFPGFVNQIDCIMKKFTCTISDLTDQDLSSQ
ncbi:hypothetical protein EWB00_001982 [Schistosoma japonicum]|uniref:Uncharacterized protein n=1 Tax=Schistosoma japonicum TaxID=6182 RepID=A0A4Z2DEA4_SCHJA|nr:hypothetical protein EWB00_001982 [Schistosoma japonicum]